MGFDTTAILGVSMNVFCTFGFNPELVEFLDRFASPFSQSWFIEIAKGGGALEIPYVERDGEIVACFSIVIRKKRVVFVRGELADWAHINGPVVHPALSAGEKTQAVSLLLSKLNPWVSYKFFCDPEDCDHAFDEAFRAAKFKRRKSLTYLRMPSDPAIINYLSKRHRNNINRAFRSLDITRDISADDFVEFYERNLLKDNRKSWFNIEIARNLIKFGLKSKILVRFDESRVILFGARSKDGDLLAAIALLLGKSRMYYWLSTRKKFFDGGSLIKSSDDAIKVLIIHAASKAAELGLVFDADGANSQGASAFLARLFPRIVERGDFIRCAPHDTWRISEKEFYGKKIYQWKYDIKLSAVKLFRGMTTVCAALGVFGC